MSYNNIFNIIGNLSPYLFWLITILSLLGNYPLIIVFIIGVLLNSMLNNILGYILKNYINQFGLIDLSGHFQALAFCFTFYILSHKTINPYILFLFLFIALCCLMNCIMFNYHKLIEIILGIIFGILFSYFYFLNIKPFVFLFLRNLI
jgi:predicted ABC-type exoprotein transport system permease subunit